MRHFLWKFLMKKNYGDNWKLSPKSKDPIDLQSGLCFYVLDLRSFPHSENADEKYCQADVFCAKTTKK